MRVHAVDDDWLEEMTPFANALRAALAEAGYPDAEVDIAWTGVFITGAPSEVCEKAWEVCKGIPTPVRVSEGTERD